MAEAELEYVDNHKSDSVYVQVPVHGLGKRARCVPRPPATNLMSPCAVPRADHAGYRVSALVWTTTPWTLPANQVGRHPTSPR